MLLVFAGCGAASNSGSAADSAPQEAAVAMNTMSYDRSAGLAQESVAAEAPETEMAGAEAASGTGSVQVQEAQSQRKLIKTVEMDIETKEFDNVLSALESEVAALGGYIENSNTYNGSSYSSHRETRWADMTVRIPEEELDSFLNTVSDISNVTRRSDNVEDVTLAYVDLESHRDALRTEQTRLLELLEQAETIEDIITIESRLSEVRYQLESMESQLRTYDNKIDYSTVYLNISEVEVFTPVSE